MGKNLILIGFMGCGKTSVGKRLAKKAGREFIDIDQFIEKNEKRKIADIFAQQGEAYFRMLETQAVKTLAQRENLVIACGGGTALRQENVDAFHETGGVILFLDIPLSVLQERLKNDKKRPLLQQPGRSDIIANLHRERYPLYKKAADVRLYSGAFAQTVVKKLLAMQPIWEALEKKEQPQGKKKRSSKRRRRRKTTANPGEMQKPSEKEG